MAEDSNPFSQLSRILLFFAVFMTLSMIMHYYIFSHLFYLMYVPTDGWFWAFITLSSLLWFLAMGAEMFFTNPATQGFYLAAVLWLGLLFMFLWILIVYDIVRFFVPLDRAVVGPIIVALGVSAVAIGMINARLLRIRRIDIPSDKVEGQVRIVHISDVHIGSIYSRRYLEKVVGKANALEPDMVLITGDLADGPHKYTEGCFAPLDGLKAPTYFTTGNHEHFAGLEQVLGFLSKTKVRHLHDEMVVENGIQVVGVDYTFEPGTVERVLDSLELDSDRFSVVMYHVPREMEAARSRGVDLMLAGHTHGGQFWPFNLMARLAWGRFKGLYDLGGTWLYVSSGTGTWGPPMRVGTSSEIAIIRVNGKAAPA